MKNNLPPCKNFDESQMQIKHKKSLGQNFLSDTNLLRAIVSDAGVTSGDTVVEIGAGAGALTAALCQSGARVISLEIDKSLQPVLQGNPQLKNAEFIFEDILSLSHSALANITGGQFRVVANLPYYITTPIIFYFLESDLPIKSLTVMVQKEVAKRMTAAPSTPDYGALTLTIAARADAKITRNVPRTMFNPAPNVDSAVVHMNIKNGYDKALTTLIRAGFSMRRKTLQNNLCAAYSLPKQECEAIITAAGQKPTIRAEQLRLEDFAAIKKVMTKTD